MGLKRNPYLARRAFKSYLFSTLLASMAISMGVVIDGIIVGNLLGSDALAAVNLASPLIQLLSAIYILISVGGGLLTAIAIGERKHAEIDAIFSLSILLSLAIGGIIAVVGGIFFSDTITGLLCSNAALFDLVHQFVRIVLLSAPIYLLLPGLCVYVRTDSNPQLASIALITANVFNILLDIVFIRFFDMGIAGASLATTIGYSCGILIVLSHFRKKERLLHFSKPAGIKTMFSIFIAGLPTALASFLMMIRLLAVNQIFLQQMGKTGITIISITFNILMIASIFNGGIAQTMQPIVGILRGSEDYRGGQIVVRTALKTLFLSLIGLTLLIFVFPQLFTSLFGLQDPTMLEVAIPALRIFSLSILLFGVNYLLMAMYQVSGRHKLSLIISCLQSPMVIPVLLLFVWTGNSDLLWYSFAISELLVFVIIYLVSERIRRKEKGLSALTLTPIPEDNEHILDFSIQAHKEGIEEMMQEIHLFLKQYNLSLQQTNTIELSCEELVLNIIQHGYSKQKEHYIDLKINALSDKILVCITDDGIPFNPINYTNDRGIGLLIVKGVCNSINYTRTMNQNVVTLHVPFNAAGIN